MLTRITVELNDEEIEQINSTQDLMVGIYNELCLDEKHNKKSIELVKQIQEELDQVVYQFCNEAYKELHY